MTNVHFIAQSLFKFYAYQISAGVIKVTANEKLGDFWDTVYQAHALFEWPFSR